MNRVLAYLHGVSVPVLEPAGPIALGERSVIIETLLLCAIVVVPVFVLLFLFAWKYRANGPRARAAHGPHWEKDNYVLEIVWWLVPAVIVAFLGVIAWRSSHALDPYKPLESGASTVEVEVIALDWKWLFIYPQLGVASVNLLELPENVPVHFSLTADAPMNSFWIPSLGGQIMVMPGMETQLNLMASRAGTFNGFSGNISGKGFAGMAFTAKAVSESDFDAWVGEARQSAPLTLAAYGVLAAPSQYVPPAQYSLAGEDVYTTVMDKFMMPDAATTTPAASAMPGMTMP